jgi:hypothetical protein
VTAPAFLGVRIRSVFGGSKGLPDRLFEGEEPVLHLMG